MNDAEVEALWRAGSLRARVRWLIATAWLLTLASAMVGGRVMWKNMPGHHHDSYHDVLIQEHARSLVADHHRDRERADRTDRDQRDREPDVMN